MKNLFVKLSGLILICLLYNVAQAARSPFFITTQGESSSGCADGAIVIKSHPEDIDVKVTIQPGNLVFTEKTPAVLRPPNTFGFSSGLYQVRVMDKKGNTLNQDVVVPVAKYSVTVPPVTDAECACNGSFATVFHNPNHARVSVQYSAVDSMGTNIGTSGHYFDLCPGTYKWTVTATSKSPACNQKVVFKEQGSVTIGGTGPLTKPSLIPASQTVPASGTIRFTTSPSLPSLPVPTFILHTPSRGVIANMTGKFVLTQATEADAGDYFVTVQVDDCPEVESEPAVVSIGGSCNMTMQLEPLFACGTNGRGSINVTFTGTSAVHYSINNGPFSQAPFHSPFTIANLAVGPYTVTLQSTQNRLCTIAASTIVSADNPVTPILTSTAPCQGSPLIFTVIPANQAHYTLTLPDGSQLTQDSNTFTITENASAAQNGRYSATFVDRKGCQSGPSNVLNILVAQPPTVRIVPGALTVPKGKSFTLTVHPDDPRAHYELSTPGRGTLSQTGLNTFTFEDATTNDAGNYFARITSGICPSKESAPTHVSVGGCLPFSLKAHAACANKKRGSVTVCIDDCEGPFTYQVRPIGFSGSALESPFVIDEIPGNASFTVAVQDKKKRAGVAGPIFIPTNPGPQATLTPLMQSLMLGHPITFIATSTPHADEFILTVPNKARGVNGVIRSHTGNFVLHDAVPGDLGAYSVVAVLNGCPSDPTVGNFVDAPSNCHDFSVQSVSVSPSCGSSLGSITVKVKGGVAPYSFSLTGQPDTFIGPTPEPLFTFTNVRAGTYPEITVLDSSSPTCTAIAPITTVESTPNLSVSIDAPNFVIQGDTLTAQAQATSVLGPDSIVSYQWTGPGFVGDTQQIEIPHATTANSGLYIVTVTDRNGCTAKASQFITVGQGALLTLSPGVKKTLQVGQSTSFVTTIRNTGALGATNVIVRQTLPSCMAIDSVVASGITLRQSGSALSGVLKTFEPGQVITVTVQAHMNCSSGTKLKVTTNVESDNAEFLSSVTTIN